MGDTSGGGISKFGDENAAELGAIQAKYPTVGITFEDPINLHDPVVAHVDINIRPTVPVRLIASNSTNDELHPWVLYLPPIRLKISLWDQDHTIKARSFEIQCSWLPEDVAEQLEDFAVDASNGDGGCCQTISAFLDSLAVSHPAIDAFSSPFEAERKLFLVKGEDIPSFLDFDRQAMQTKFSQDKFECDVCMETKEGALCHRLRACSHVFCIECLQAFYKNCITRGDILKVTCLQAGCQPEKKNGKPRKIKPSELIELHLEPAVIDRYSRLKRMKRIESDVSTVFCPIQSCQGPSQSKKTVKHNNPDSDTDDSNDEYSPVSPATPRQVTQPINPDDPSTFPPPAERLATCSECNYLFCKVCKAAWHGVSSDCGQSFKVDLPAEEQASAEYLRESSQRCPDCRVPAQKSSGCNHMTCWNCRTEFCFLCGIVLTKWNWSEHFSSNGQGCNNQLWDQRPGDDNDIPPPAQAFEDEEEEDEEEEDEELDMNLATRFQRELYNTIGQPYPARGITDYMIHRYRPVVLDDEDENEIDRLTSGLGKATHASTDAHSDHPAVRRGEQRVVGDGHATIVDRAARFRNARQHHLLKLIGEQQMDLQTALMISRADAAFIDRQAVRDSLRRARNAVRAQIREVERNAEVAEYYMLRRLRTRFGDFDGDYAGLTRCIRMLQARHIDEGRTFLANLGDRFGPAAKSKIRQAQEQMVMDLFNERLDEARVDDAALREILWMAIAEYEAGEHDLRGLERTHAIMFRIYVCTLRLGADESELFLAMALRTSELEENYLEAIDVIRTEWWSRQDHERQRFVELSASLIIDPLGGAAAAAEINVQHHRIYRERLFEAQFVAATAIDPDDLDENYHLNTLATILAQMRDRYQYHDSDDARLTSFMDMTRKLREDREANLLRLVELSNWKNLREVMAQDFKEANDRIFSYEAWVRLRGKLKGIGQAWIEPPSPLTHVYQVQTLAAELAGISKVGSFGVAALQKIAQHGLVHEAIHRIEYPKASVDVTDHFFAKYPMNVYMNMRAYFPRMDNDNDRIKALVQMVREGREERWRILYPNFDPTLFPEGFDAHGVAIIYEPIRDGMIWTRQLYGDVMAGYLARWFSINITSWGVGLEWQYPTGLADGEQ